MRRSDMLRAMAESNKVVDASQQLAEFRERVRSLEERVDALGRHL